MAGVGCQVQQHRSLDWAHLGLCKLAAAQGRRPRGVWRRASAERGFVHPLRVGSGAPRPSRLSAGRPPPHGFHKHILTSLHAGALPGRLGLSWVLEPVLDAGVMSFGLQTSPPCFHIPWTTELSPFDFVFHH